jgi:hypothetical protein
MRSAYKKSWSTEVKKQMGTNFPEFRRMSSNEYCLDGGIISSSAQIFSNSTRAGIELFVALDPVRGRDAFDLYLGWSARFRFPSERWDSLRDLNEAVSKPEFLTTGQDLQIFSGKRNTMSWSFLEIGDDIDSPDWLQRAVIANLEDVSEEVAKKRVERTVASALEQLAVMSAPLFRAVITKYGVDCPEGGR